MTDSTHIADAYVHVARVNHYLVTVTSGHSWDELCAAEQILITRQNASRQNSAEWKRLELALDLIGVDIKKAQNDVGTDAACQLGITP